MSSRHQRYSSIALASTYVPRIDRLPFQQSDDAEDLLRDMSRGDARYVLSNISKRWEFTVLRALVAH